MPANAGRVEGSCHECRAPWNESAAQPWDGGVGGGGGGGGGSHKLWRRRGSVGGNDGLGRLLPRRRVIGNLHVNGQSRQRAGCEALSAHVRACVRAWVLCSVTRGGLPLASEASPAFHLAHYRDGNLSVAVIRPRGRLPHLESSNRPFTAAFTDAE